MRTYIGIEDIEKIESKTVVTLGTFDGVHKAHQALLERTITKSKELNACSVVITFDPHPRTFFSPTTPIRQLSTIEEKKELLEACGIDILVVVTFDEEFAAMSAYDFYKNEITLPLYTKLTDEQLDYIIAGVRSVLKEI